MLAHAKCNIGRLQPSREVWIQPATVEDGADTDAALTSTSNAVIGDVTDVTADEIVTVGDKRRPRSDANKFLRELLADGPHRALEIYKLAGDEGISERTLKRAKADLGVDSFHATASGGGCWIPTTRMNPRTNPSMNPRSPHELVGGQAQRVRRPIPKVTPWPPGGSRQHDGRRQHDRTEPAEVQAQARAAAGAVDAATGLVRRHQRQVLPSVRWPRQDVALHAVQPEAQAAPDRSSRRPALPERPPGVPRVHPHRPCQGPMVMTSTTPVITTMEQHRSRPVPESDHDRLFGADSRRSNSKPLEPQTCRCDRPILMADDDGDQRCVRCGREGRS
jgi:hypothetical protein